MNITLLANDTKMCMNWSLRYTWEVFSMLRSKGILSHENHQYINIVLALSIYLRTSAYLSLCSETRLVSLSLDIADSYKLPYNLFVILGCLLIPIKNSIHTSACSITDVSASSIVDWFSNEALVVKSDLLVKAEVYYFIGQYDVALYELSKEVGSPFNTTKCSSFLLQIDLPVGSKRKWAELCCYLLYYTKNYAQALDYLSWLSTQQDGETKLWKLLAAHCNTEMGNYVTARQLLNEVSSFLLN